MHFGTLGRTGMDSDIFPFEQSQRPFAHVVHTESVFAHHDGPRRRSAKAIHSNDIAPVTNIAMPPLGYPASTARRA